jgi:predicted ribosome quality control (RQC) complex YloA/Tae2 family protein
MLSLRELRRAARILEKRLAGALIQRINQLDDYRLVITFYASGTSHHLLLNCLPQFARLNVLAETPQAPAVPPAFAQYLRAHLGRAAFVTAQAAHDDRQVALLLRAREGEFRLILSILGSRSNTYLLDGEGKLLYAMRRLEHTRPELVLGQAWTNPPGKLRSEGIDRWEAVPDELYLETIQEIYSELERRKEFESLARKIEQALNKETSFQERKAANLSEDLGEALKAEEYRRKGELLKTILHAVRPGAASVPAVDFETGEEVVIPLDPQLSATENLESYFRRYQKDSRGADAIRHQLEILQKNLVEISDLQESLRDLARDSDMNLQELTAFAQRPLVRKLLARRYPPHPAVRVPRGTARPKEAIPSRLLPRRYRGEHGLEIWVGRSDEGNDFLTCRLARGNDLFFHLEGYPGSHVVLRTEGRKDPPPEALLDACELAVHYSKLKDARSADVHVVPIKNVRKPRGSKPGLVHVSKGKTVHLRRNPKRLEDILASRLDE